MLSLIVYLADAFVLGTYALLTHTPSPRRTRWFHWANAVGGVPTLLFEVGVHAWPVMPLTGTFCVLGWYGVWRTR